MPKLSTIPKQDKPLIQGFLGSIYSYVRRKNGQFKTADEAWDSFLLDKPTFNTQTAKRYESFIKSRVSQKINQSLKRNFPYHITQDDLVLPPRCPTHKRFMNKKESGYSKRTGNSYGSFYYCPLKICSYTKSIYKKLSPTILKHHLSYKQQQSR